MIYFWAFINFEQNDLVRFLSMAEFAYNNTKNASIEHTSFKLNCGYHSQMLYDDKVNPRSQSKLADKLLAELGELIIVCHENLYHTQELQKRAHDKRPKS